MEASRFNNSSFLNAMSCPIMFEDTVCQHGNRGKRNSPMLRELLIGTEINGYKLEKMIGGGAMGAIYQATHPQFTDPLAVKVMSVMDQEDPEFIARFQREAKFLKSLSHPNIVPLLDYGQQEKLRYLVMP